MNQQSPLNKTKGQDKFMSAVTDKEIAVLQELAFQKIVLEIGSQAGFSASMIALSAARVDCVDPFYDDPNYNSPNYYAEGYLVKKYNNDVAKMFLDNTRNLPNVFLHVGESAEVVKSLMPVFDMVFIDGDHSYDGVITDLNLAFDKVKYGGIIALHDYEVPHNLNLGVKKALTDWLEVSLTMPIIDWTQAKGWLVLREQAIAKGEPIPEPPPTRMEVHVPELPVIDSLTWFTVNWK